MEFTGQDIFGATLGLVGMGRIGAAVARRLSPDTDFVPR